LYGVVPIALLALFVVKRYRAPQNDDKSEITHKSDEPVVEIHMSSTDRILLIIIMSITFISYSGLELMHFTYSSTYYQYNGSSKLSASTATKILSLMSATFTAGRLLSAVIAIKLNSQIMIGYSLSILCLSMAVLYFGQNSETLIWTGNALIGRPLTRCYSYVISV